MPQALARQSALSELRNFSGLRLQTSVRLRWLAVLGQLATIGIVYLGLGFDLPIGLCLAAITASAWVNIILSILYPATHRLSTRFAVTLLAYDVAQLSLLLFLTGGIENPFFFLLVAPVIVSASTLPTSATVFLATLTAAAAGILYDYHMPVPWHAGREFTLPVLYRLGVMGALLVGMAFLALYAARLAREARQMSAALAATESVLAREQRLHALDGLAAAAAHELGTPLSTITVVAKELSRAVPPDSPIAEDLALLQSQAVRCREILLTLAQRSDGRDPLHAHLTISQLIEEAAGPYRDLKARPRLDISSADDCAEHALEEPTGVRLPGVIYGLRNLIENAADFATSDVTIIGRWTDREVRVEILDDGPGYDPDIIDALGEPYVTTRPAVARGQTAAPVSSGLGLGIFIAKTLLERSGARVTFSNRVAPARGAAATVIWSREAFENSPVTGWRVHGKPDVDRKAS